MRTFLATLLLLALVPTVASATRYGSLQGVDAVHPSVTVNPDAVALGLAPEAVTGLVQGVLTAEGVPTSREATHRLVVLVDALTLDAVPDPQLTTDTHFCVVRLYLVRDRAEGALVLWEDMVYGGWSLQGRARVRGEVEGWLRDLGRDFALDYFRDVAGARAEAAVLP